MRSDVDTLRFDHSQQHALLLSTTTIELPLGVRCMRLSLTGFCLGEQ